MKCSSLLVRGIALHRLAHDDCLEMFHHLLRLSSEDRRLRFGGCMRDVSLERYAAGIDLTRDAVFGVRAVDLKLIGMAHVALDAAAQIAELALSVDATHRGKGYGTALFRHAISHATNLGCRELFIHFLTENAVVMHLARRAGLTVVVHGSEASGRLALTAGATAGREARRRQRPSILKLRPVQALSYPLHV
jgi:GNAT superfamily N-acetyltransferase